MQNCPDITILRSLLPFCLFVRYLCDQMSEGYQAFCIQTSKVAVSHLLSNDSYQGSSNRAICHRSIYSTFPQRHIHSKNLKNTLFFMAPRTSRPLMTQFLWSHAHQWPTHTDPFSAHLYLDFSVFLHLNFSVYLYLDLSVYLYVDFSVYLYLDFSHWSWPPIICEH